MDWVCLELREQQRTARQDRLEFESYRKATDSKLDTISDALQLLLRRTGAADIGSVNSSGPGATFTAAGNPVVAGRGTADAGTASTEHGEAARARTIDGGMNFVEVRARVKMEESSDAADVSTVDFAIDKEFVNSLRKAIPEFRGDSGSAGAQLLQEFIHRVDVWSRNCRLPTTLQLDVITGRFVNGSRADVWWRWLQGRENGA